MTRKRAILAAALAVLHPGVGHIYLREWVRALFWVGLTVLTTALFVPDSAVVNEFSISAVRETANAIPDTALVAFALVLVFNVFDAYVVGRTPEVSEGVCPYCGKELGDESLSFCQWCAADLEPVYEESEDAAGVR